MSTYDLCFSGKMMKSIIKLLSNILIFNSSEYHEMQVYYQTVLVNSGHQEDII